MKLTNTDRNASSRTGVTLTEMLVVLTIVAAIAVLLMPVLSRGRARAEAIECMQRLRASGQIITTLIAERGVSWATFVEGTPEHHQWARRAASLGMIEDRKTVRCPTGETSFDVDHVAWAWQTYGLNLSNLETGTLGALQNAPRAILYTLYPARIQEASRYVLLADSASDTSGRPLQTFRLYHKASYRSGIYPRHDGRANVLFFDGHAESLTPQDLQTKGAPYYDEQGIFRVPSP